MSSKADSQGYVVINGRRVRLLRSTGDTAPKRTRSAAAKAAAKNAAPEKVKLVKTPLNARQLKKFRDLLLAKRRELLSSLGSMENEALRSGGNDASHMPIHMADIGSDNYDQDLKLGMAASERQRIAEIDDALKRIVDKTYGVCRLTGEPIPESRLQAKPWAQYTIESARKREGRWKR